MLFTPPAPAPPMTTISSSITVGNHVLMFFSFPRPAIGSKELFATGPHAAIKQQHNAECIFRKEPVMLQTPSFKHSVCGLQGLAWQSIDPEPFGESVRTGWWKVQRAWLAHTWNFFPPVHVAMVHQFLPSFQGMSSRMQRKPFLRTSAPQIDSLEAQEMSAMTKPKDKDTWPKLSNRKSKAIFSAIRASSGRKMGTANCKEDQRYR